ncbi:MAG: DUF6057 family protein [candidate division KSB1 bacterium]|nr:DUF6057 family protein [candidate division KSB1 bacterium]
MNRRPQNSARTTEKPPERVKREAVWTIVWYASLLIFLFFYFWQIIRPELYFTAQEPVFYLDRYFLKNYFAYPGGFLDGFSAFLGNLCYQPLLGAFSLSLLLTATAALFSVYLYAIAPSTPRFLASLVLIPLLVLFSNYAFPPLVPAAVMTAMAAAAAHTRIRTNLGRVLFALLAGTVLYYAAGTALYLYALATAVFEVTRKNVWPILILAVLCLLLPLAAGTRLFTISPHFAFTFPLLHYDEEHAVPYLLYITWAIALFVAVAGKRVWDKGIFIKPFSQIVQLLIFLAALSATAFAAFRADDRQFWQFSYFSRMGQWEKILKLCEKPYLKNQQVMLEINRALAQLGRLGDRMFYYRQPFGREGLFVLHDQDVSTLLIRSDLYFDMGHYNAARQWAHEAASVRGETIWNTQRLALCYLILGQNSAAELYFRRLEKSLFHRGWAKRYRPYWQGEKSLLSDRELAAAVANRVSQDFITLVLYPERDFPHLLRQNPRNRTALDYMFADLLLSKKLKAFTDEIIGRNLLTRQMPRHYQQALIFYASQVRDLPPQLQAFRPDREVLNEFGRFQALARQHAGNLKAAQAEFEKQFGHTYWYYLVFHPLEKES